MATHGRVARWSLWCLLVGFAVFLATLVTQPLAMATGQESGGCDAVTKLRIGAAQADITGPAAEVGMMGYADSNQRTAGIHMRLRARAFTFYDPCQERHVAIVIADLGMIFGAVKDEVLRLVKQRLAGRYHHANLLLAATHTHNGPGGYAFHRLYNLTTSGFNQQNFTAITEGIAQALIEADSHMEDGVIRFAQGDLEGASFNRSPGAYLENPLHERNRYPKDVDTTMSVLRFEAGSGRLIGSLNWFAVHPVSLTLNNKLISGDNKGVASYLHEKEHGTTYHQQREFISAFAQANAGDVSPYAITDGPLDLTGEYERLNEHAGLQYRKVQELFDAAVNEGTLLSGPLDYRHQFLAMGSYPVEAPFVSADSPVTTCPGALGLSFAAGTINGKPDVAFMPPGLIWGKTWPALTLLPALQACHAEKPILLPSTLPVESSPWTPQILPFQVLRLGSLVIVAAPAELATMAGRRLKETVAELARAWGGEHVVLTTLANEYSHYVTTREEYRAQAYEGASTQFGPWTLRAYQQIFARQTKALFTGVPTPSMVWPRYEGAKPANLQPGVVFDTSPSGQEFGGVANEPAAQYKIGETIAASFWGGHPKNDLRRGGSFLDVQVLTPKGWRTRYEDADITTFYQWQRVGLAHSLITISWNPGPGDAGGEYRLCHAGEAKHFFQGTKSYRGCSRSFKVLSR